MSLPAYNAGGIVSDSITVYYAGTDTLQQGYSLCWDSAASATATDQTKLGNQVVKPATANLLFFAGIVAPGMGGRVGPCFVDIITPLEGRWVLAMTKENMTLHSTHLGITNAGGYNLVSVADATFNDSLVGIAGVTVDTSTTAALKLVLMK